MSTAVVIRDPKAYVTPDVWEREVALLLRNLENTRELAEAKFGQAIAYLVTCGENPGPNESVLGPVAGRRVLELGSGSGSNLAHLVTLGATGQGVDIAPARETAARERWGSLPGLEFRTEEATAYLNETHET